MNRLNGLEKISQTNQSILDFWSWAYSDILSNRNRAIFAEFIVASALNITNEPRIEWDEVDLRYLNKKIEVKSSAYLQSWQQEKLSLIQFDISKKKAWNSQTNNTSVESKRNADCYVFCLFTEKDSQNVDVLNVNKWKFYVVKTTQIEQNFANQKTVSLNRLEKICNAVRFEELTEKIEEVLKLC